MALDKAELAKKLDDLLNMECDWPVFHKSRDGISYEVKRMKVKDIAFDADNNEHNLLNIIKGQTTILIEYKRSLLDLFAEKEPDVDLTEFKKYMGIEDPVHDALFEQYMDANIAGSKQKSEELERKLDALPSKDERVSMIIEELPTALSEHKDMLVLAYLLDKENTKLAGKALKLDSYFASIERLTRAIREDHELRGATLLVDGEIKLLKKKHSDSTRSLSGIGEFAYDDKPRNFALGKGANNDLIAEEDIERMRIYRDANQVAVETLTQFVDNVDKIITPYWKEIESQKGAGTEL